MAHAKSGVFRTQRPSAPRLARARSPQNPCTRPPPARSWRGLRACRNDNRSSSLSQLPPPAFFGLVPSLSWQNLRVLFTQHGSTQKDVCVSPHHSCSIRPMNPSFQPSCSTISVRLPCASCWLSALLTTFDSSHGKLLSPISFSCGGGGGGGGRQQNASNGHR